MGGGWERRRSPHPPTRHAPAKTPLGGHSGACLNVGNTAGKWDGVQRKHSKWKAENATENVVLRGLSRAGSAGPARAAGVGCRL